MTIHDKKKSDERRIRYYNNLVKDTIELALMNTDLTTAITLTFAENITNYDMAIAKFQLFIKRLRHHIDKPLNTYMVLI